MLKKIKFNRSLKIAAILFIAAGLISTVSDTSYAEESGPEGYKYLGKEGETVHLEKYSEVAYGANGKYVFRRGMKGTLKISNGVFGDPVPGVVKSAWYKEMATPELEAGGYKRVLYLNFRGVTLNHGDWDPLKNTAKMPFAATGKRSATVPVFTHPCKEDSDCRVGKCSINMPERNTYKYNPFKEPNFKRCSEPDPEFEQLIRHYLQLTLQDFNINIVTERPQSGNYDMVIFNYNSTIGVASGGSAPQSCNKNRGNVIIFVQDSRWGHGAKYLATIAAHEFGHSLGMAHTVVNEQSPDPMKGGSHEGEDVRYRDKCVPYDTSSYCKDFHLQFCPPGQHNTYRIALDHLGPATVKERASIPDETKIPYQYGPGKKPAESFKID